MFDCIIPTKMAQQGYAYTFQGLVRVTRQVYQLKARIRSGNSGGPFVDDDGVVRGMIFAASADNPNEAYALSSDEIARAHQAARQRARAVGTGSCAL